MSACDAGETNPPDEGKGQERVDELQTGAVEHGPDMLLRGGKVMTAAGTILETGDVLVIDGKGDLNSALIGGIMSQQCMALGIAAVVAVATGRTAVRVAWTPPATSRPSRGSG